MNGLSFVKLLFSMYICVLYLVAAYLIHKVKGMHLPKKEALFQRIKYQNLKYKKQFVSEELDQQFRDAGHPFNLTGKKFQIFRYSLLFFWLSYIAYDLFIHIQVKDNSSVFMKLLIPSVVFFLLQPKRVLIRSILEKYKERMKSRKNQEIFMLYSMISDDLNQSISKTSSGSKNMQSYLRNLKQYTPLIRSSINKGLRYRGIHDIMRAIGDDIGTEEAKDVCKIIASLEEANTLNIHELIQAREQDYVATLRENRKKRRKSLGYLITAVVFLPMLIYISDIFMVIMQAVQTMNNNLNNLG